jgi:hypothetical protein
MFLDFLFSIRSIHGRISAIFGCILVVFTCGCTAQQIEYQALAHNQAFSASADKILLTNIIRSSRILPVDYTAITEYKAKEVASGSLIGKLPFGPDALRAFNADPSVSVGPGISSLDIKDFAQQKESFTKLHEDLEIENFGNLVDAGWEGRLIETMLFQSIRIRGEFARQLILESQRICDLTKKKEDKECKEISEALDCGTVRKNLSEFLNEFKETSDPVSLTRVYVNSGDDKCEFLEFQALLSRLELLKISFDVASTKQITPFFFSSKKGNVIEGLQVKDMKKIHDKINEDLSGKNRACLEIIGRSTNLMVRFLGQLTRSQLYLPGGKRWIPGIHLSDNYKDATQLFVVTRGASAGMKAAVTTEFEGEVYSIPDPNYEGAQQHKSLYLFSFLRIRLDQAYAQTKLPPSNTLILR